MTKTETTDYYAKFKNEVAGIVGLLHENITVLIEQIAGLEQKRDAEQSSAVLLKERLQRIKDKPLDFDEGGEMTDIAEFKKTVMSLSSEIQATDLAVNSLVELLDRKRIELTNTTDKLKNTLIRLMREKRPLADENCNSLLLAMLDERDAFTEAFQKIYADFGLSFVASDESLIPSVMNAADVQEFRFRIEDFNRKADG
ncbi:MAG: hypothetical protein JXB18_11655 [Sedimentisphaerales bacterium]|nr:hypothetical protein [Sedimentisphaerales bacterium]